MLQILII